ncbi:dTMP kinase [Vacuolonema iberomarrocanum]|uniref:dTMP kinase n=1 Tax=Vacuolonema iberomarrocanum TaxID=3454632 RepID=UPI001A0D9410|nr:dTMP kinase [filamentous cyanobacterium LEGE 07170]
MTKQGRLIVFEGGEGAGKTTQLRRSHDWLQASDLGQQLQASGRVTAVMLTREPGGTDVCREIRELLLHPKSIEEEICDRTELLLYAADRAQHIDAYLKPYLEQGALILCDRFTDSTVAYQGYGRGLDLPLIHQLNQIATNGLTSDLTLWLDLDVEVGLSRTQKRGDSDRMEKNALAFHQRVRQGFQTLAHEHPQRITRIDATPDEDMVFDSIKVTLTQHLANWYDLTVHE